MITWYNCSLDARQSLSILYYSAQETPVVQPVLELAMVCNCLGWLEMPIHGVWNHRALQKKVVNGFKRRWSMVSQGWEQWTEKTRNIDDMIRHYSSHGDNIIVAHNVQLFVEILWLFHLESKILIGPSQSPWRNNNNHTSKIVVILLTSCTYTCVVVLFYYIHA